MSAHARGGCLIAAAVLSLPLVACSGTPTGPNVTPMTADPVLIGAGDIAHCGEPGARLTAALLDLAAGTVFTAGDNAYPHGSLDDFMRCYEPTWGRHKNRTLPTPGNHDYETPGAQGYFRYFGARAGVPGEGYYTATLGRWLILLMNSNIDASATSAQMAWLRASLQQSTHRCVAAIWHHPLTSSGPNGGSRHMAEVWRVLHEAGADLVINGDEHLYERYGHLDALHQPVARGMRQFVVGTGGATLTRIQRLRAGSQVQASVWGVLKLTLRPESYEWEFLAVDGHAFRDQGQDLCR